MTFDEWQCNTPLISNATKSFKLKGTFVVLFSVELQYSIPRGQKQGSFSGCT